MKDIVSIRGAISARNDSRDIAVKTNMLADRMYFKNELTDADIVNIQVSVTDELTAYSPATALREGGHNVALFSSVEPKIEGSLPCCIRLMITARSVHKPHNVYLGGARALRHDLTSAYAIALDGPSGAGKSTVAKAVAEKLGITYLDTGALYRALGLVCLERGVSTKDGEAVEKCLKDVTVGIEYREGAQRVISCGADVSDRIRTPEVSMAASDVSAIPFVRQKLLGLQRSIAETNSVILDGRDIGTVVLPDAEYKFFLTAAASVRAKRRFDELKAKGRDVTFESVYADVITRDRNDSTRSVAPLKRAYDAWEINSDELTAEQVVKIITDKVTGDMQ